MRALYVQKGDGIDFVAPRDVLSGEVICRGNIVGITKLSAKAGKLGTLCLNGVFDVEQKKTKTVNLFCLKIIHSFPSHWRKTCFRSKKGVKKKKKSNLEKEHSEDKCHRLPLESSTDHL